MASQHQSQLSSFFLSTTRTLSKAFGSLKDASTRQLSKLSSVTKDMSPYLETANEFYQDHKEVILVTSAVALTYLLTRSSAKKGAEEKQRPKKMTVPIQKTFVSDEEENEEPSMFTGKTAESSEKELVEKRCKQKILQKLSSSENEDQKIFFEMYKTYQNA